MNDDTDAMMTERLNEFSKTMRLPPDSPLTREQLAVALYEGTPQLSNLAEKMARQYGDHCQAIPFYTMTGQDIRDFWLSIAGQIIEHSKGYGPHDESIWSARRIGGAVQKHTTAGRRDRARRDRKK
jgi:hypothetical protein